MARGQPFTQLCQQLSRMSQPISVDLHVHTTASDGEFTVSQLLLMAKTAQLTTIAFTDHDTLPDIPDSPAVRIIPAVEFSTIWQGSEWHLLGYFLDRNSPELTSHLQRICQRRRERFHHYVQLFRQNGATITEGLPDIFEQKSQSLGRRHLAQLLTQSGQARTRHDAFQRWILPLSTHVEPTHLSPLNEILELIHSCGGAASLAHPPQDLAVETLAELRDLGLDAVEARYPAASTSQSSRLTQLATSLQLGITGGSDLHGSANASRWIGSCGLTAAELQELEQLCGTAR